MRKMEYSPESDFNVNYDGKSMVILSCGDKESREIIVPPTISGAPVTGIGNGAFSFCHGMRRIVLPDTVTFIENAAFRGCGNLVDAVLSKELRSIGALSFAGCSKLRRVTLPNCLERFEINSFRGCDELREIVVYHRERKEYFTLPYLPRRKPRYGFIFGACCVLRIRTIPIWTNMMRLFSRSRVNMTCTISPFRG